ncbi:MAG TPA: hypothetical protein OIM48_03715 [Clostridiaceae bacterium]|nr:hypothetical protein [Clostridiaceae bacterium]
MGTWGTGLYQDDTTCDVKEEYLNLLKIGTEPKEAMEEMIINWEDCIEDVEEGPLFWFALAETQWRYGLLDEKVKEIALQYIEEGIDLERWEEDQKLYTKRKTELEKLKEKLESEQPQRKKIPKMTFQRANWKIGDIILYQILNENLEDHKWYKKYVLLKMAGTRKSNIGSLPREIYYNEYDLLSLYNWIGDKEIDIEKIDELKIIFLEEENVYEPIVTIVGEYFLEKKDLKKINAKVIKNDMKNLYTEEVRKKYPRYHGHNINNFDTTVIRALEREEKRGNLVKDFEE